MNRERARKEELDFISKLNGYGSLDSAQTLNLRGINHNRSGVVAPVNQDSYGFTFFTRPRLNLSYDNLSASRMLRSLQSQDRTSMARAIRVLLDPVGAMASIGSSGDGAQSVSSDIVSNRQAFIPILSNNLISMSGWPDLTADTYTSKQGVYKEAYSMVDGTTRIFNTFDVTANFKNVQGDPITLLFAVWVHYASMVYEGTMVPYPDAIIENEIDYNTRIYRLVMDKENRYIQKIAACGAAFPMASPLGAAFNFSNESKYSRENDQISIPFRCMGANYMDDILVKEFNETVSLHAGQMRDENRGHDMMSISAETEIENQRAGKTLLRYLNHRMQPRINPSTMELEWWVEKKIYETAKRDLKDKGVI